MSLKLKKKLKKSLSQNFLVNASIADHIASAADYDENKIILEIGCGKGALTQFLCKKKNKAYHIVEYDERWAKYIYEEYKNKGSCLSVFCQSILDHVILSAEQYIIVSNIPYHITYPIIEKIWSWALQVDQAVLMMQEEVAQKLVKRSGSSYGPISVVSQLLFDLKLDIKVTPENFVPAPKVDSRVVIFSKKIDTDDLVPYLADFKLYLGYFFAFPRKKIKHQGMPEAVFMTIPPEFHDRRAQEINPRDFLSLYKTYNRTKGK
jgi:16S rRNA (adenine1518-N6/adenine1519-N6)-dimethyltransferase